jgi:acetoin utilization deacetylase AcuC-like enzyme
MRVVASPRQAGHAPLHEFADGQLVDAFEIPARAESIARALVGDGGFTFEEPTDHGVEPILAVHDEGMLRFLEDAWRRWRDEEGEPREIFPDVFEVPAMREGMGAGRRPATVRGEVARWAFDIATPIVEGTYDAARSAVDVALSGADLVLGDERLVYGLCRPPGHHAARALYGGYCFFNNAAIAAEDLVRRTGDRVSILDVDYHHGNGTQQLFYERGDVLYVSLHGDPDRAYPYLTGFGDETGSGAGAGANLNLPLGVRCADDEYLANVDRALEAIDAFGGDVIVVSLGIDTYERDPICDLAVTTAGYHEVGRRVAALGRRVLVLQEGGYFVPHLGENVRNWLLGLEGRERDLSRLA